MNLIERVKNIITRPNLEWELIDREPADVNKIMTGYVLPLAAAAALAAFIGYAFIGINMLSIRMKGIDWGLYQGLTVFITAFLSIFISALVIDALAPSFGSQKNFPKSVQLTAYSFTPVLVGGLLAVIPSIGFLGGLFGFYGFYLLYLGLAKLKGTPPDKHVGYYVVSLLLTIAVYVVVGWILTRLLINIFGLNYGIYDNIRAY